MLMYMYIVEWIGADRLGCAFWCEEKMSDLSKAYESFCFPSLALCDVVMKT